MKQTSRNIGGPLLYSFILACVFMGVCAALYGAFFAAHGAPLNARFSLFASHFLSYLLILPLFGLIYASPGLALAYMLLVMRKNPPRLWLCLLCGTLIGGLITLFWMPLWSELDAFTPFFMAGGPLTALFYYCLSSAIPTASA
jgi:hypothetical protein